MCLLGDSTACSNGQSDYSLLRPHSLLSRLKKLVENGPHPLPGETGARYIIREDGNRLDLRYLRKESDRHLEYGYKVSVKGLLMLMLAADDMHLVLCSHELHAI